ncbi:MAG: Integral membrane protein TerC, partial [uncultured Frankineae bacterium]
GRQPDHLVRHDRRPRADPGDRPADRRPQGPAHDRRGRGHQVGGVLRHPRGPVRDRAGGRGRRAVVGRVLRRLPDRVLPVGRQPVRLRHHHGELPGALRAPAQGAAVRDRAGARAARRVHRGRRRPHRGLRRRLLPVRRLPHLHGCPARPAPRRGAGGGQQPAAPADGEGAADDARVRRRQGRDHDRRQEGRDAAAARHDRDRLDRHPVRARLDPGDLRSHEGAVHRLHGQRLRPARPAPAVLPARRSARPADLPVDRAVRHPGLHRREAHPRGGARDDQQELPRGVDPGLARLHRHGAGHHDGRVAAQDGQGPGRHQAPRPAGRRGPSRGPRRRAGQAGQQAL